MKMKEIILPSLNQRILDIVNNIAGGNVAKFARSLEGISQQRIDRIFKLDTRTKKIPSVHNDIVVAIIKKYPEFNSTWLLTGVGTMLNDINGKIPKGNIVL